MNLIGRSRVSCFVLCLLLLTLALPIAASAQTGARLVVNTHRLNVRSGPGVGYGIVTSVAGGTELPVIAIDSRGLWFQVEHGAGSGWVNSYYTAQRGNFSAIARVRSGASELPANAPRMVVNTHRLNIRSGPGAHFRILTSVRGGTELAALAMDYGGLWFQVQGPTGEGWVNSHYTIARGDFSRLPQSGALPVVLPMGTPHLVVNTHRLNIRSGPGVGYGIITSVRGGAELPVVSIHSDRLWHEVEGPTGRGWVNAYYTVSRGDFSRLGRGTASETAPGLTGLVPRVVVNTHRLNIRTGPGAANPSITSVQGGTTLAVKGISANRNWFLVEGSFGEGWLNNAYTVFRGAISRVPTVG